ncbi:MAG TPA: hypothetical protein VGB83_02465 [Actinomycetota bacterium]
MDALEVSGARGWVQRARFAFQFAKPRRTLFVLSHMRSYSSLLCHILHSNADITGYIEQHASYRSSIDLLDLRIRLAHEAEDGLSGRYVLDKILHNKAKLDPAILRRDDVFCVFMVREPEMTIKSTLAMVNRKSRWEGTDWKSDPAGYYVRRLDRLVELAELRPRHSLFFEADSLIDSTDAVLAGLSSFLELKHPLAPTYETFELTGKPRFGDPGKFIGAGEIVKERNEYADVTIPEEDLLRAKEAFERTRDVLTRRCTTTVTSGV